MLDAVGRALFSLAAASALAAAALVTPGGRPEAARTTPPTRVTVAFVGDIALLGPAPSSLFTRVRGPLRHAAVAIGNLEGTLGSGGTSKCAEGSTNCFAFQSPAQSARLLRGAGFDDLNVANNHAFDFGASGEQQTLHALARNRLHWSGRPGQITVLRAHGLRVAVLGFAPYPWAQSLLDIAAARRLVQHAAARADLVVAVLHAGAEGTDHQHVPRGTEQYLGENRGAERRFAHALVGAGADLVVASGPHVLRGLQLFHHRLIAYSLGNFATAGGALTTEGILGDSAILLVTLRADGRLAAGRLLPVRLVEGEPQRIYGSNEVIPRVNALSREDFGSTAVLVAGNNRLRVGG
jgi:poly-gamma-glutamate capsule biosynthesis protein CapA/YwtB (metallophosphatase superfamily)